MGIHASAPSRLVTLIPRVWPVHPNWLSDHLAPVLDRLRTRGPLRAAPASLALATASLLATASVRLPTGIQHAATDVFVYRGHDFYTPVAVYQVPLSGLLAQSWSQWVWTAFVAALLFAPLEARVGTLRFLGCVATGHLASTAAVALVAPAIGHASVLAAPDYGTSCLIVGAAAGYAWLRRSWLLAALLAVALAVDAVLSAPVTTIEHWIAAGTGAVLIAIVAQAHPGGSTRQVAAAAIGRLAPGQ